MKLEKIEDWTVSDQKDMQMLLDDPETPEPLRFRLELALLFRKYNPFNHHSSMTLDDFFRSWKWRNITSKYASIQHMTLDVSYLRKMKHPVRRLGILQI